MTLQTRAAEIHRFAERYQRRRNLEADISTLQERSEVLSLARRRIQDALQALSAMSDTTVNDPAQAGDIDAHLSQIHRQAQKLIEDPGPLRKPNSEEFKVLRAQVNAAAESLVNAAKDRWRDFVASRRPPRVDALVKAFGGRQPQVASRLREATGRLNLLLEKTGLPNSTQVERADDLYRQVSELQSQLIGEDASAELVAFTQAAGSPEGAPIDPLTHQVWGEIERLGIEDAFRVWLA